MDTIPQSPPPEPVDQPSALPRPTTLGRFVAATGRVFGLVFKVLILWVVLGDTLGLLIGLAVPAFNGVQEKSRQLKACNNARQIISALKAYAADHNGRYPDADTSHPRSANKAFRLLIKGGYIKDELLFSAPASPEVGDGNLGPPPDYPNALEPNENHWALMAGLTTADDGSLPLVFECPNDKTWPPTWNADVAGQAKEGRAWRGGKIIVGRNDGSVNVEKLDAAKGERVPTQAATDGTHLFDPKKPREYLMPQH